MDVTTDPATTRFNHALDLHSLVQHVTGATHHAGHCLDVLITRRELCVRSISVDAPMLSDHSCIVGRLYLLIPQDHSTVRRERRCWRQFDFDCFYADLRQSEMVCDPSAALSVTELFDRYTIRRFVHCLTYMHRSRSSVSERHALLRGTTTIVDLRRSKLVALRSYIVAPRPQTIRCCGTASLRVSGISSSRN